MPGFLGRGPTARRRAGTQEAASPEQCAWYLGEVSQEHTTLFRLPRDTAQTPDKSISSLTRALSVWKNTGARGAPAPTCTGPQGQEGWAAAQGDRQRLSCPPPAPLRSQEMHSRVLGLVTPAYPAVVWGPGWPYQPFSLTQDLAAGLPYSCPIPWAVLEHPNSSQRRARRPPHLLAAGPASVDRRLSSVPVRRFEHLQGEYTDPEAAPRNLFLTVRDAGTRLLLRAPLPVRRLWPSQGGSTGQRGQLSGLPSPGPESHCEPPHHLITSYRPHLLYRHVGG